MALAVLGMAISKVPTGVWDGWPETFYIDIYFISPARSIELWSFESSSPES